MYSKLYIALPLIFLLVCVSACFADTPIQEQAMEIVDQAKNTKIEMNTDDISNVMTRAKDYQGKTTIPDNLNKKQGEEKAKETFEKYKSEEFQSKLKAEMERIQKALTGETGKQYYRDAMKTDTTGMLSNEQIYIFISSSMPVKTIRNYVQDVAFLDDPNIKFVLRGFVGGMKKIQPTTEFISNIIKRDPACTGKCESYKVAVQINPMLYRRYNIDRTPAILYVQGVLSKEKALSKKDVSKDEEYPFWLIYGDASLETATELFADKTKRESLKAINRKLRGID